MTMTDARNVVGEATVGELQAAVRGQVIRPGDNDYDEARAVWNAAHDKHPALIVRCAGTADVIKAVEFARSQGLPLAVRGGAHSIAGFSTSDGGVVIDLSPMKAVKVDPQRRRAVAQGGATWADFDHETQAFGLAVDRRPGLHHRARRIHAGRGYRLAAAQARPDLRQPRLRRRGHRGRPSGPCQRRAEQRPVLGAARRRRQLRRCHVDGVRAASGGPDGPRRAGLLPGRRGPAGGDRLAPAHRRRCPTS